MGGLPAGFAILLWAPGMVIILGLYQIWFLPIQVVVHLVFAYLAHREPHFFEVFKRALRAQRRLEP